MTSAKPQGHSQALTSGSSQKANSNTHPWREMEKPGALDCGWELWNLSGRWGVGRAE